MLRQCMYATYVYMYISQLQVATHHKYQSVEGAAIYLQFINFVLFLNISALFLSLSF